MPSMYRHSDGSGDSGSMCEIFRYVKDPSTPMGEEIRAVGWTRELLPEGTRPTVGYQVSVGSPYARTMQWQDWWQCSPVVEILKDEPDEVQFKTRSGQVYTWRP